MKSKKTKSKTIQTKDNRKRDKIFNYLSRQDDMKTRRRERII